MGVTGQNRESHEKEKDWTQVACQNANPRSALVFAVQTLLLLLLIIELGLTRVIVVYFLSLFLRINIRKRR